MTVCVVTPHTRTPPPPRARSCLLGRIGRCGTRGQPLAFTMAIIINGKTVGGSIGNGNHNGDEEEESDESPLK